MNKQFPFARESYERITIKRKRTFQRSTVACEYCGEPHDLLTVSEAAELFGAEKEDIRKGLEGLRRQIDESDDAL